VRGWSYLISVWAHLLLVFVVRCNGWPAPTQTHTVDAVPVALVALPDAPPPASPLLRDADARDPGADLTGSDAVADATAAKGGSTGRSGTAEASTAPAASGTDPASAGADRARPRGKLPVADATPPDRRRPDRADPDRPDRKPERQAKAPEPKPEPEAKPDPPEPLKMQRFLRTDGVAASAEHPDDPEYIGARNVDDAAARRAPVVAKDAGPWTPPEVGTASLPSPPTMNVDEGRPADPAGDRPATHPDAAHTAKAWGGGGRDGEAHGKGEPGEGGDREEGGPAAHRSGGGAASAPRPERHGDAEDPGSAPAVADADIPAVREAPRPDLPPDADVPAWWRPHTVMVPPAPAARAAPSPVQAPASPTDGDGEALVERPGQHADRGGSEADTPEPTEARPAVPPRDGTGPAEGEGAIDPVADVRASLGFTGVDHQQLRPPASPAGISANIGAPSTSPQAVLLEDVENGRVTWAKVGETPLGRYTQDIYQIVQEGWYAQDLDDQDKALGIQGRATVVFRVHRNGRVSGLAMLRSSGHASLDALALQAVPDRLPRFPRNLDLPEVVEQITFHYRNPLIVSDGP